MNKSKKSIIRANRRNSPANLSLKNELNEYLINRDTPPLIAHAFKMDLKKMTDMPFYGQKILRPAKYKRLNPKEILIAYIDFLFDVNDIFLSERLLRAISRQQSQVLRRISPRIGLKKDVWDHLIPTSYIVSELLTMLRERNIDDLSKLIDLYVSAGQRGLTKEEDNLLTSHGLKNSMPPHWNWRNSSADIFCRYKILNINI
jgi:hypothetical protein